ncbi:MAG TPA: hypothetical protein VJ349_09270 [Stellaceae bacterium]|nr:hypothetical protein [Stellaceae bacterium]
MTTGQKPELYRDLARQLEALIAGEPNPIANAANTAALHQYWSPMCTIFRATSRATRFRAPSSSCR